MGVSENRLVPHCTQWFCWSLSLLNGYFIGNINPTFSDKPTFQYISGIFPVDFGPMFGPFLDLLEHLDDHLEDGIW